MVSENKNSSEFGGFYLHFRFVYFDDLDLIPAKKFSVSINKFVCLLVLLFSGAIIGVLVRFIIGGGLSKLQLLAWNFPAFFGEIFNKNRENYL